MRAAPPPPVRLPVFLLCFRCGLPRSVFLLCFRCGRPSFRVSSVFPLWPSVVPCFFCVSAVAFRVPCLFCVSPVAFRVPCLFCVSPVAFRGPCLFCGLSGSRLLLASLLRDSCPNPPAAKRMPGGVLRGISSICTGFPVCRDADAGEGRRGSYRTVVRVTSCTQVSDSARVPLTRLSPGRRSCLPR